MGLEAYRGRRDFGRTPEPSGAREAGSDEPMFVIQKHAATRLHYDLRLELDGVLKSWAVPKGPSLDPGERRLAIHVEDHPLEYGSFEGVIPSGEYGGGTVLLWDRGRWRSYGDAAEGYRRGRLRFRLEGAKLRGDWNLVRMADRDEDDGRENWLLIKARDAAAKGDGGRLVDERPESVATGRTLDEIAADVRGAEAASAAAEDGSAATDSGRPAAALPDPASLEGARRGALPRRPRPALARLEDEAPAGDDWLHEIKFDGYRALCRRDEDEVRVLTRNGNDWTARFPTVAEAVGALPCRTAVLDGEVVVVAPDGTTSFQRLQDVLGKGRFQELRYYAFDLLYLDGYDLSAVPLEERKAVLERIIEHAGDGARRIRYSDHVVGHGADFQRQACGFGVEGIISKRRRGKHRPGRSRNWRKIKCWQQQEFVVGGYTDPAGGRTGFGSLLLGVYDRAGELVYAGRVGTGFTDQSLRDIHARLRRLECDRPPFTRGPVAAGEADVHWVEPELVAEVAFAEWTRDGVLRHPSFKGLREDRPAREVVRERGGGAGSGDGRAAPRRAQPEAALDAAPDLPEALMRGTVAGVRLTNPDRVFYPDVGVTKAELAARYAALADRILPRLAGRPLTLVRCPSGVGGDCFFQKHAGEGMPAPIGRVDVKEEAGEAPYMYIRDAASLVSLFQMGALELHVWGARVDALERPDRIVFDLDPGPGVDWRRVVQAARELRLRLLGLGLASFVKTTGGKGLHVVVPLKPATTWEKLKDFAQAVAETMASASPDRYTARLAKSRRRNRIFIDYLRNTRGATAVAPYSPRARPGALVAMPLRWDELRPSLDPKRFHVRTMTSRLEAGDPWSGMEETRQTLTAAMWKELREERADRGDAPDGTKPRDEG